MLTGGAGGRAATRAFTDLFDITRLDPPPMAGRTDRWIFAEMARRHGVAADADTHARLRDRYLVHLAREIAVAAPAKRILPGVRPLLDRLSARSDVHLALLTGNAAAGARIKLEHFDLWRYFSGGGFGDASLERTTVFHDAIQAVARATGVAFPPHDTVIVGDTPMDVAVAVETGARSVAVATGGYAVEDLQRTGADAVLEDLSDLTQALTALGIAAST